MSAILAIFQRDMHTQPDYHGLKTMLEASADRAVDGQKVWVNRSVALAHQHFWITPEEWGEEQPLTFLGQRVALTADVRLDNRNELRHELNLDKNVSDAVIILMAYHRWGTDCVTHFLGDFSFALWDEDQGHLFIARDPLGTRGLCYYLNDEICIVGSQITQLLAHPSVELSINEGKVVEFLGNLTRNQEESYFRDIFYCPPGNGLLITSSRLRKWCYWEIEPQEKIRYQSDEEYADHFLTLLTEAIRCRLRTSHEVGISMSGGLDSTMLAALTASIFLEEDRPQKTLMSFSYIFEELTSCDERQYMKAVEERWNLESNYVLCDHLWTFRDIHEWPATLGHVTTDPYAWLPVTVAEAAKKKGCRLLLAGYYGDILFINGRNWAASMIGEFRLRQLFSLMRHQRQQINFQRDVLNQGLRKLLPHNWRDFYRRKKRIDVTTYYPGLHENRVPDLEDRTRNAILDDSKGRYQFDQWERALNLTPNTLAQGFSATRFLYNKVGLELCLPYWDRRLVEFIMAIPADQLGRPGRNRWLLRNAGADFLPMSITERNQKTSFRPLMERGLLVEERSFVQKLMENPLIVEFNYVKRDWLREQFRPGQNWIDSEHHYFLWKSICLELWLRKICHPQASYLYRGGTYV